MKPELWGRGAWIIIFVYFYKKMNTYLLTSSGDSTVELTSQKITKPVSDEQLQVDVEDVKRFLYIFFKNLPCVQCANNALNHLTENNIMSVRDPNIILHFIVELYNLFHEKKIDRNNLSEFLYTINNY